MLVRSEAIRAQLRVEHVVEKCLDRLSAQYREPVVGTGQDQRHGMSEFVDALTNSDTVLVE